MFQAHEEASREQLLHVTSARWQSRESIESSERGKEEPTIAYYIPPDSHPATI
jgi:hypothetical protein